MIIATALVVRLGDSLIDRTVASAKFRGLTMTKAEENPREPAEERDPLCGEHGSPAYGAAAVGIDIKALLGSVAIVGLAVGFGAQSLVKDVITGFFIIYERAVRCGRLHHRGRAVRGC